MASRRQRGMPALKHRGTEPAGPHGKSKTFTLCSLTVRWRQSSFLTKKNKGLGSLALPPMQMKKLGSRAVKFPQEQELNV